MKPRVWIISGGRLGDLRQMQVLAKHLGWPHETRLMKDRGALDGPPPDLVLCAEQAASSAALELKRKSGVKLVCLTRPRGRFEQFDLIITTPQFDLPAADNILEISLPLTAEPELRQPVYPHPRPYIALLVGGSSPPYLLEPESLSAMLSKVRDHARSRGGSLFVSTSPRTGQRLEQHIGKLWEGPGECFLWSSGGANPLQDYLGAADEIIVSEDSVSMAADAIATGKPVYIYALPKRWNSLHDFVIFLNRKAFAERGSFLGALVRPLFTSGLFEAKADLSKLYGRLATAGRIAFFGQAPPSHVMAIDTADIKAAVARVRALFPDAE